VSLSWQPSTDDSQVGGYEIRRDGEATPIGTSVTTSFTDSGLEPGHSHTYTVVAVDQAGNSSLPSFAVSASTTADGANTEGTSSPRGSAPAGDPAEAVGPDRKDCG
jgi:chitodextrinase